MQDVIKQYVTDEQCADLILKMTEFSPHSRITAADALQHPFITMSRRELLERMAHSEAAGALDSEGLGSSAMPGGQLPPTPPLSSCPGAASQQLPGLPPLEAAGAVDSEGLGSSAVPGGQPPAAPPPQLLGLSPAEAAEVGPQLGHTLPRIKAQRPSSTTTTISTWPGQPQQPQCNSAHQPVELLCSHAEHGCGVVATAGLRLSYVRVADSPPGFGPRPGALGDCLPVQQTKVKRQRRALYDRRPQ